LFLGSYRYGNLYCVVYLLFIIGFILLIKGADLLIEGSSVLAKHFGISDLIVGLTVVAFGTSLPELIVNLFAGATEGDLAIGNIIGSNIANILLILGVSSLIKPLFRGLDRIDGVILMSYFAIFLYYTFGKTTFTKAKEQAENKHSKTELNIPKITGQILLGGIGLFFGGKWIVDGAVEIATLFGASSALIGLTIVAIGTSLPELAASVIAVRKGSVDIAVGNAVGSNLFNIFWVLGLSATINPLKFSDSLAIDAYILVAITIALFLSMIIGKTKHEIGKNEGIIFLIGYVSYLGFAISNGGA